MGYRSTLPLLALMACGRAPAAPEPTPTRSITGTVTGSVAQGVSIALRGPASATVTTDSSGRFVFEGLASGNYVVTPSLPGYAFSPENRPVVLADADLRGEDFSAARASRIAGTIRGRRTATVDLGGDAFASASVDATGSFAFRDLVDGRYTLTPHVASGTVVPASRIVEIAGGDALQQDFEVTYALSGQVVGATGVTMMLSGASSASAAISSDGSFAFNGLARGTYRLTPSKPGFVFSPPEKSVSVDEADAAGNDFQAFVAHRVCGTLAFAAFVPLTLTGATNASAVADAQGSFCFPGVADGDYLLAPSSPGLEFSPKSRAVRVHGTDVQGLEFRARMCSSDHWCWENPAVGAEALSGFWGSSPSDVWTIGASGRIFHWNGSEWAYVPSGTTAALFAVWGSSSDDVWAVGTRGTVLRWNGERWSSVASGTSAELLSIWGSSPSDVWAVGALGTDGIILHWDGKAWSRRSTGADLRSTTLKSVSGAGSGAVWTAGSSLDGTGLFRWDGAAWRSETASKPVAYFNKVWANSATDVWAVGGPAAVQHWDGSRWSEIPAPSEASPYLDFRGVWGASASDVWMSDVSQWYHWDGKGWTTWKPASYAQFWGLAGTDVWVANSYSAALWHFDGKGFVNTTPRLSSYVGCFWASASDDIWLSGDPLMHWDGARWSPWPGAPYLSSCWGTASDDIWALDYGQKELWHWDGKQWSRATTLANGAAFVWASSPYDVWMVRNDLLQDTFYHWNGKVLSAAQMPVAVGSLQSFSSMWGTSAVDVWAVGYESTLHWDGRKWSSLGPGPKVGGMWGSAADDVWAVGSEIHRWDGKQWTSYGKPGVALSSAWGSSSQDVWAIGTIGTDPLASQTAIVRWDGAAWARLPFNSGIQFSRITGTSATDVWAFGSNGAIIRYHPE